MAFSAATDRNKEVIGDSLQSYFESVQKVLEIGSGTGQHAVYMAERFADLTWQPTDKVENLTAIHQRVESTGLNNILPPIEINVASAEPTDQLYDFAFSANTAHIMSLPEVSSMFALVARCISAGSHFALYGPFSYGGTHTAPSNESFDAMLRQQAAHMGIRDKATLDSMALDCGLDFVEDIAMPANNRILLWRR